MSEILQIYLNLLKWDISVFCNPWMYIPLLIPIIFFIPFFFLKWAVLTAPIWIPLRMIRNVVVRKVVRK